MTTDAQLSSYSVLGGSATYIQDGSSFLETGSQAHPRCAPVVTKASQADHEDQPPPSPRGAEASSAWEHLLGKSADHS